jgi:Leucine-rich repeat (LRR) protein
VHYIHLTNLGLTGVFDVSGFDQLQTLDVPNNNLTEINLSGCTSLSWLQVDREILANLDLSELPALEYVS